MNAREKILLADVQEVLDALASDLREDFDVIEVTTYQLAHAALQQALSEGEAPLCLVITGVHFDDSSMLTLLKLLRSLDAENLIPFLPIRMLPNRLGLGDEIIDTAIGSLGGYPVVRLENLAGEEVSKKLRESIRDARSKHAARTR